MMQVADTFFSHPDKNYNDHIDRIAQSFDDENHQVVANYHDMGKLSDKFQTYISLKQKKDESTDAFEKRRAKLKTTHTLESAYLYFWNEEDREGDFLANFFAILKHHSSLSDIKEDMNNYLSTLDNYVDDTRLKMIKDIASKSSSKFDEDIYGFIDFFANLYEESSYRNTEIFFLFKKRYSCLILADEFEAIFSQPYKNIDYLKKDEIKNHFNSLHAIIKSKPKDQFRNNAKKAIFNNFEENKDANIFLIKAPTGVGKTFIAFELALKIAEHTKDKRRIITALPFTSIIDQTHSEYENIIGKGKVLKYHHLTKYGENKQDEKEQFSQKVFLTDIWQEQFIVTTFNQLLFTFFSNHNRDNVRLETLRDSVIIIDEIQNISRVLLRSVAKVFSEFSKRYNIHFIIMSATMPSFEGLLDDAEIISEDSFYEDRESRYRIHYKKGLDTFVNLSQEINKTENKSLLCVVNTIEKAKKLFDEINADDGKTKFLLTTHQIPLHRKEIIEEIKEALGKGEKIILISTQLIEAGVDLDFDIGFREFAPFGSIIQMAGRVNREGTKGIADIYIFDFLDVDREDEAKKLPYHNIDLQECKIKGWLENSLEETKILKNLDTYFETLRAETTSVDLETAMKNLEFRTLFKLFNENFMPNQPWKISLFVELKAGQFDDFIAKREEIFNEYKNKFDALNHIKNLEKDLGLYTISINRNLIEKELIGGKHPIRELFGRFILPHGSQEYTKYRGFSLELATLEESIGFE